MKKVFAALLATLAIASGAQATENRAFDGPYVGAQIGSVGRSLESTLDAPFANSKDSQNGFEYGLFVGHDWDSGGKLVFGVEAGVANGAPGFSYVSVYSTTNVSGDLVLDTDPKWSYDLTARAGVKASHDILFYGRAGYGGERLSIGGVLISQNPYKADRYEETGWSEGLVLGGGVELAVVKSINMRVEYRHRDMMGGYAGHQILGGIAYRF
jgi:outer membrane immunogenic protein